MQDPKNFISQKKCVGLLNETEKLGTEPTFIPIELNHKFGDNDGEHLVNVERYQRFVGKLIYMSLTRSDIAYVVSQLIHAPRTTHLEVALRIFRCSEDVLERKSYFESIVI